VVHSILPPPLEAAAGEVLDAAGLAHVAHGEADPVAAAGTAAGDGAAIALLGPYRSADVAEAVEATAPAGLPLLAPVATWAGVTRDDEPGCEDPARHRGTVLRLVARDTEVATRLAADVRAAGQRAHVVAGRHPYGRQLDGQLALGGLPRATGAQDADLVVVCGLAGEPEVDAALAGTAQPVVAFDGIQGAPLPPGAAVTVALPYAPAGEEPFDHLAYGARDAKRAARLVAAAATPDRTAVLGALRAAGPFDAHGDPVAAPVWLWQAGPDWALRPARALRPGE